MGQRLKAQGSAASQEIKIPNTRGRGPCDPLATSGPSIIEEGQAAGPPQSNLPSLSRLTTHTSKTLRTRSHFRGAHVCRLTLRGGQKRGGGRTV